MVNIALVPIASLHSSTPRRGMTMPLYTIVIGFYVLTWWSHKGYISPALELVLLH